MNATTFEGTLGARLPIRGRLLLLSGLSALGALAFVPSIVANSQPQPALSSLVEFVLAVTAVCVIAAWAGLRLADAAHLRMPWLRRLDASSSTEPGTGGAVQAVVCGLIAAAGAILLLRYFHQQNLGGSLLSKAASTLFAAVNLEVVIHLFVMSLVVWLARGRVWLGIAVATVVFIFFHASGSFGAAVPLMLASVAMNGVFGLLMGLLYARYGFEYVVLGHAVGHVLAVTLG